MVNREWADTGSARMQKLRAGLLKEEAPSEAIDRQVRRIIGDSRPCTESIPIC